MLLVFLPTICSFIFNGRKLQKLEIKNKKKIEKQHQIPSSRIVIVNIWTFFPDNTFFVCIFLRIGTVHADNFISNIFFQISPTTYLPMQLSDALGAIKANIILCWIPM